MSTPVKQVPIVSQTDNRHANMTIASKKRGRFQIFMMNQLNRDMVLIDFQTDNRHANMTMASKKRGRFQIFMMNQLNRDMVPIDSHTHNGLEKRKAIFYVLAMCLLWIWVSAQ